MSYYVLYILNNASNPGYFWEILVFILLYIIIFIIIFIIIRYASTHYGVRYRRTQVYVIYLYNVTLCVILPLSLFLLGNVHSLFDSLYKGFYRRNESRAEPLRLGRFYIFTKLEFYGNDGWIPNYLQKIVLDNLIKS